MGNLKSEGKGSIGGRRLARQRTEQIIKQSYFTSSRVRASIRDEH